MASDGNWGGALGVLVGQLLFFYVVQAILYFGWRWLSGDRSRTLYTSRINYLSLALGLLSLAGQMNVAMRHGL